MYKWRITMYQCYVKTYAMCIEDTPVKPLV